MLRIRNLGLACSAVVMMYGSVASAAVLDDFNRTDSANLGSGWTQQAGASGITGNQAFGSSGSLATFNGGSGDTVSFDLYDNGTSTQYGAAVIGWGSASSYFIKVQNNGGGSGFSTYGFYTGNNGGGFFGFLTTPGFTSAHVSASVVGTLATLTIDPNVGAQQVYTHNYGAAFSGGVTGLGFYGDAHLDNFGTGGSGAVPEPTTWALMLGGFGLAGAALRRRRAAIAA